MHKSRLWIVVMSVMLISAMLLSACPAPATPAAPVADAPVAAEAPAVEAPAVEAPAAMTDEVEVFSWWTGGGKAAGLVCHDQGLQRQVSGHHLCQHRRGRWGWHQCPGQCLATRLQAGDSPDSWQGHAGQELIGTYVAADQLEALNFLFEQEGWLEVMPETLIP